MSSKLCITFCYPPMKKTPFIRFDTIPVCDGQTDTLYLIQRAAFAAKILQYFDPFKPSGVRWLHFKVFSAILV